ncbi:MAG: tetratricopeptide repeat protein [Patescibacteria group bacterium]
MILDYIAIAVLAAAIIAILVILWRKFSILAAINTETIKEEQQSKVKRSLIEGRLKRKLASMRARSVLKNGNVDGSSSESKPSAIRGFYNALRKLEQNYRSKIRELEPQDEGAKEKNVSILIRDARALRDSELYKEAEQKYIEAISVDSRSVEAYENLGGLYVELRDYDHAKEIYQYLLKLRSTDLSESPNKQTGSIDRGDVSTVSLAKEVAGYHVELGEVYRAEGEPQKALDCFQEAVKLEPNNPRNLDRVAETALELKDKPLVQATVDKLREVNPENEKLAEFEEALKQL